MKYNLAGFNGQRPDPVSGHYHSGNGYRAYNPVLGRFSTPDSWSPFAAGGINPYAWCAGDPVNRADPSGHFSPGQGIGIALGFVAGTVLSIVTEGAAMPVVLTLVATMAGDAAIGAGAELATEAIDRQGINWGVVGIAAGLGAASSLAGFGVVRGAGKISRGVARLAGRLQRVNGQIGIPMSGEFRNACFLGISRIDNHISWNVSFEDSVPFGRRLTIMMSSRWENDRLLPFSGVWNRETEYWEERVYYQTIDHLRDAILWHGDNFDVYRLAIPDSAIISDDAHRGAHSLARRFFLNLPPGTPVVAFRGTPQGTGPAADALANLGHIADVTEQTGQRWSPAWAQLSIMNISETFSATDGAITFGNDAVMYPLSLRVAANRGNWQ